MHRFLSFQFASDGTFSDSSDCKVLYATNQLQIGVAFVDLSDAQPIHDALRELLDQPNDGIEDGLKTLTSGLVITLSASTGLIGIGSFAAIPAAKADFFAKGLVAYGLAV